jgi:hypothetical protein
MPKRKSSKTDNHVRVKSAFTSVSAINTAAFIASLGNIGADATSILSNCQNLTNLSDMFRLMRLNSIRFEFQPAQGNGTASVQVPSGFLAATPYGITANPTSISDFETPNVSQPTASFGTASTTAPMNTNSRAVLDLSNKDLPVIDGPGGGWISTQEDGTQDDYGILWWVTTAVTAANTLNYILRTYFDVSFKDLLDPSLISSLMARHPNGLPPHIVCAPGTPLWSVNQSCLQGIKRQPRLALPGVNQKPPVGTPTDDASSDVQAKIRLLRKQIADLSGQ